MTDTSEHPTHRFSAVFGIGFLFVAGLAIPNATLPPTISLGDPTIEFHAPKIVLAVTAVVMGWAALFIRLRRSPMSQIFRALLWDGMSKWASFTAAIVLGAATFSPDGAATAMFGRAARLDGALVVVLILHLFQVARALVAWQIVSARTATHFVVAGGVLASALLLLGMRGLYIWSLLMPDITFLPSGIGTVGNTGALTNYLSFVFVLAVLSSFRDLRSSWWYWVAALVLAIGTSVHVGRAGVLSSLIALSVATILMIARRHGRWPVPLLGVALLMTTIATSAALTERGAALAANLMVLATEAPRDVDLRHRLITWELGMRSIFDHPWVGTGPGSFAEQMWAYASEDQEVFLRGAFLPERLTAIAVRDSVVLTVLDPETNVLEVHLTNYDKSHNYFIDLGVAFGLFAALAAILFWGRLTYRAWQRFSVTPQLLGGMIAFMAAQQFWFMSINVDPALYVAFGALAASTESASIERS